MTHFEARSVLGRPLATFDSIEKLRAFRDERRSRGVNVRGFIVRRTEKELTL